MMSESSTFSFPGLGRKRPPDTYSYEALLEFLPHAACIVDPQTLRILFSNPKIAELTGYTRSELSGLHIETIFTNQDPENSIMGACSQNGAPITVELTKRNQSKITTKTRCVTIPQGENHVLIAVYPTETGAGKEDLPLFEFWDGLYKMSLAPQQADLNSALNIALQAGLVMSKANTSAIYRGQSQSPDLECCACHDPGQWMSKQLPAQDLVTLRRPTLWRTGNRPITAIHRYARAHNLAYLASAPMGQSNALIGLVVVGGSQPEPPENILRITELLAATATTIVQNHSQLDQFQNTLEVREHNASISSALETHMDEGLLLLTPELEIIRLNPAAETALGYSSRDVLGQPVDKVLIGTESLQSVLNLAHQGSSTHNLVDIRLYRRNGDSFQARLRIFPILQQELVKEIIVLFQDLSDEEQMRMQAQQLEQRAILGEVTAVFAHEVRNPINNISTGLQLMAYNFVDEDPNQETLSRLLQDCDRLEDLIKSVLSLSRPINFEMESLQLPQLLEHLLERLRPRITRLGVQLSLQTEAECPPIQGNQRALEQVFANLINNAMQAMREHGGQLALKVKTPISAEGRQYVEVSVADTGPGIPKELQERIFLPFFTTERTGTGIGLAIAKRIVTTHNGTIGLESFPGGTIFTIQFPAANPLQ